MNPRNDGLQNDGNILRLNAFIFNLDISFALNNKLVFNPAKARNMNKLKFRFVFLVAYLVIVFIR